MGLGIHIPDEHAGTGTHKGPGGPPPPPRDCFLARAFCPSIPPSLSFTTGGFLHAVTCVLLPTRAEVPPAPLCPWCRVTSEVPVEAGQAGWHVAWEELACVAEQPASCPFWRFPCPSPLDCDTKVRGVTRHQPGRAGKT